MFETGKLIEQDTALWEGLEQFSKLPDWLIAARDPRYVCSVLSNVIPEFKSGQLTLHGCEIGHIRYKNDFWSGLYELEISRAGETTRTVTALQGYIFHPEVSSTRPLHVKGVFGTEGWQAIIPDLNLELRTQEPETVLAALQLLTDPEESRRFLERSIRKDSPAYPDLQIQSCTPNVVRYKPGSRCTVLYHLDYPPGSDSERWPELVVAKTYRGEKGQNAYDGMLALIRSPLGSSQTVTVAEPLAYDPEERVLVQGPIREEQTLKDLYRSAVQSGNPEMMAALEAYMEKTARGLAELHRSGVSFGRIWDWEDEMSEVRDRIERLAVAIPGLARGAAPLLERLSQLEAASPPDPLVPSHGSFRPAQVLLYQGKIGFIDFDSFCQSEPANDLALFLSIVMSLGMTSADFDEIKDTGQPMDDETRRTRFALVNTISNRFLDTYEMYLPVSRQRVALWETLHIFMLVLHGWIKIKVGELDDVIYLLEQFLLSNRIAGAR